MEAEISINNAVANKTIERANNFFVSVVTYMEQHFLSHSLQLADALIGATAIAYSLPILTGNDKHYNIVKDIQITEFRP